MSRTERHPVTAPGAIKLGCLINRRNNREFLAETRTR